MCLGLALIDGRMARSWRDAIGRRGACEPSGESFSSFAEMGDEVWHSARLNTRLTLKELSQTHHMRRRVFLDETKSARELLRE